MSMTKQPMNADEATVLAAEIDKSHLPVHVKQVTCNGIVMIQDDNTGYTLPIVSPEHWRQYAKQQGEANAIDEFVGAGLSLMSQLDMMLTALTTERDALLSQAEQVDNQITRLTQNKNVIESAIMAVDNVSLNASLRGVTVAPSQSQPTTSSSNKAIHRTKQPKNMPTQGEWISSKLHQDGRIKISTLAVEMSRLYNMPKERAATNISGEMSRQMKADPNIKRVAPGEFILVIEGTMSNG